MDAYDSQTLTTTAEMAAVAAFAYAPPDGAPRLIPVTPLLLDGSPAFTLAYSRADLAFEISASSRAALVFSDSRLAYVGWSPLAVGVRVEVVPDPEGEVFLAELLDQELRKYPPDRQLVDSPLLRRENWWYMPRFVVRVVGSGEPRPVDRREGPDHGVLAYETGGALAVETVRVEDWDADRIPLRPRAPAAWPEDSRAALFHHDFAVPDMDPRATFLATGRLHNGRLAVEDREGSHALGGRPGLVARLRAQGNLKRRCKAGIKRYA